MIMRRKISLILITVCFLSNLTFSCIVFYEMLEQSFMLVDAQLKIAISDVFEIIEDMATPEKLAKRFDAEQISENYWFRVLDSDGRLVYRSKLFKGIEIPGEGNRGKYTYVNPNSVKPQEGGNPRNREDLAVFRVREQKRSVAGTEFRVQVAQPVGKVRREIKELLLIILAGLVVSTVLVACISNGLARQIIKPIKTINDTALEIQGDTLGKRIPRTENHDEIDELIGCLNLMFDRLENSFSRQKKLLADASHELKSPIAVLRLSFEDIIQQHEIPEPVLQQLQSMEKHVLRLDRLNKMLLDLSVLELHESLHLEEFDLSESIRTIVEQFSPLGESTNLQTRLTIPERVFIVADRERIHQVLINVLDNAIKYNIADGEIEIHLETARNKVCLSVANTGPGIPEDDLPKVFDQFFRVEKSRSPLHGGIGLGLTIVKEIIHLHKGTVTIESKINGWTKVIIVLPKAN